MANGCYLAMTAGEFQNCSSLPGRIAWMSCHFSPYGKGLSNLPQALPPGSMLILDDANTPSGHDPDMVLHQLHAAVQAHICSCVLLDFQRPGNEETARMAAHLTKGIHCPVAVSHIYAQALDSAVLLPPIPPDVPLEEHIRPWFGREIWLELSLNTAGYRVTKDGSQFFQPTCFSGKGFVEENLCCHYTMALSDDHIDFTLWRTAEDLSLLMEQAEKHGISQCVGLWQELWNA